MLATTRDDSRSRSREPRPARGAEGEGTEVDILLAAGVWRRAEFAAAAQPACAHTATRRRGARPMLLSVRVIRLEFRHDGPAPGPRAASSARCCGSRPPRTGLQLEGATRVHATLEAREAGLVMPRNVVEISSDGSARCMGCQYSMAVLPDASVDATNGAQFSYRVNASKRSMLDHSATLQHVAASGTPLTLSFTLQLCSERRKAPARAELDVTALMDGSTTFAGWLPLRAKSDTAHPVAELLVEVAWLTGGCARATMQLVAGDAEREIKQRFSLLEQLGSGSFATVRTPYNIYVWRRYTYNFTYVLHICCLKQVWRAVPVSHGRKGAVGAGETEVAIKLLDKAACIRAGEAQAARQLIREQQLLRELEHPRLACCSAIVCLFCVSFVSLCVCLCLCCICHGRSRWMELPQQRMC